ADPGSERVLGAPDGGGLAPHEDLAAVGLVVAVQDAHQGGLAGAVLADDAVDRTRAHRERHVTVGVNVAEPLVDPPELDRRRGQRVHFRAMMSVPLILPATISARACSSRFSISAV